AIIELALNWNEQLARLSMRDLFVRVLRTAQLRSIDALRGEKRRLRRQEQFCSLPPEQPIDPERKVLLQRERTLYLRSLLTLPPCLRDPLVLSIEGDLTCRQISAILDIPIGTVKTRLRRARAMCSEPRIPTAVRTELLARE